MGYVDARAPERSVIDIDQLQREAAVMQYVVIVKDGGDRSEAAVGPFKDEADAYAWIVGQSTRYAEYTAAWYVDQRDGGYDADEVPPTPEQWWLDGSDEDGPEDRHRLRISHVSELRDPA
jgi:hypothetical protein